MKMLQQNQSFNRIAITGFALCNALGFEAEDIWQKTLAMHSGIVDIENVPLHSINDTPEHFFVPHAMQASSFIPGQKSYCRALGLCRPPITRDMLNMPPQDFSVMAQSSKGTLYVGKKAIEHAMLHTAEYEPQRVGIFVSQNSGESASSLWDAQLALKAPWIAAEAARIGAWNATQTQDFIELLQKDRILPSDNTLLCRLNCIPGSILLQQYGFCGPSFSVGAACSSAMAALSTAVHMLQCGHIDAAVVGGGEETYSPLFMAEFAAMHALAYAKEPYTQAHQLSRPFDKNRTGFILAEGAAMIVLEREDTARKRQAHIHGLISGFGHVTNTKGLVEPDAHAQTCAIKQAFSYVDYSPNDVDLIECHATGTVQGDREEGRSLIEVYGHTHKKTYLTSYKGQIGHTTGASGLMSLIHGLLAMRDSILPATANYTHVDPDIPLDDASLCVLDTPETWTKPQSGIRRMQLNSFAFGGMCFALLVEEDNDRKSGHCVHTKNTPARIESCVENEQVENGVRLVQLVHQGQRWRLGALTPQWQQELAGLPVVPDTKHLHALQKRKIWLSPEASPPQVAITCCGQGSVWPSMGRELYNTFPAARAAMDRIASAFDWDVLSLMDETNMEKILLTRWQQPYLFLLEYAQASYLASLGFQANVMSGHSFGELVALCLAGVYTLEDACIVVDSRAKFTDELEKTLQHDTGMLAVYAPLEIVKKVLTTFPELHVSNYNTATQYVLSGEREMLTEARRSLRKQKYPAVMLNTSMAFHHPHMRAARVKSLQNLRNINMQPATLPMLSNVTAELYPHDKESIYKYIVDLDENPVRWVDCVHTMWHTYGVRHFVELGPMNTISSLTGEIFPQATCIALGYKNKEVESVRQAVAQLYTLGHISGRKSHVVPSLYTEPLIEPSAAKSLADTAFQQEAYTKKEVHKAQETPPHIEDIMPILMENTGYSRDEIHADMDLRHDLAIRSSRFPAILYSLEKTFHIHINFEDILHIATVRDLANIVVQLRTKEHMPVNVSTNMQGEQHAPIVNTAQSPLQRACLMLSPLDISEIQLDTAQMPQLSSALIVGVLPQASWWQEKLTGRVAKENIRCVEHITQAHILFEQGFMPTVLILTFAEESARYDVGEKLLEMFSLLQIFLRTGKAHLCIVHEETHKVLSLNPLLGSPLFAGLNGIALTAAQEYPKVQFKMLHTASQCANDTLEKAELIQQLVQMTTPQYIYLQHTEMYTLRYKAQPWRVCKGISITKEHVIIVSGGASGITPHALEGLAPLGCTFILLGRSTTAQEHVLEKLTEFGAQCAYYSCDVTDSNALRQTIGEIYSSRGRIDGIIHAAGVTKDAPLASLSVQDMADVFQVKYGGLQNLLTETAPYNIRYVVTLSSVAAWFGNVGQANYSAANRAVCALLETHCQKAGIAWRSVWLPPVFGAVGMAAAPEIQELLRLRAIGYIQTEELPLLFAREVLCGESCHSMWHRELPMLATVLPPAPSSAATCGLEEGGRTYAELYPLAYNPSIQPTYTVERHFSEYRKDAVNIPHAAVPRIKPERVLEALYASANMVFPWLFCYGCRNIRLEHSFLLPHGVTRESRITVQAQRGESIALPSCTTKMLLRTLSANGRRTDIWESVVEGQVFLGTQYTLQDIPQKTYNSMQKWPLSPEDVTDMTQRPFIWMWICLNILKNCALDTPADYTILGIERLYHVCTWSNTASLQCFWQCEPGENDTDFLLDGRICQEDGTQLLLVQGLRLTNNRGL